MQLYLRTGYRIHHKFPTWLLSQGGELASVPSHVLFLIKSWLITKFSGQVLSVGRFGCETGKLLLQVANSHHSAALVDILFRELNIPSFFSVASYNAYIAQPS